MEDLTGRVTHFNVIDNAPEVWNQEDIQVKRCKCVPRCRKVLNLLSILTDNVEDWRESDRFLLGETKLQRHKFFVFPSLALATFQSHIRLQLSGSEEEEQTTYISEKTQR